MRLEAQWEKIDLIALILMYEHYDLELDSESIIDKYAKRHPRKMLLLNPLA